MNYFILSMRDIKANMYTPPIFVPNINASIRDLQDAINDPNGKEPWQKHPEDFELWELGIWESDQATFDVEHDATHTTKRQLLVLSTLKG